MNLLLSLLAPLPSDWALVAIDGKKAPLGNRWQETPLSKADFEQAMRDKTFAKLSIEKHGKPFPIPHYWAKAIGVLCGTPSGGLLFVDHDGASCDALIEAQSGVPLAEALPPTVAVTSGRPGRYQLIYRIPEQFWGTIATHKFSTGVKVDGKPEQLELRWDGCQSVVAGVHPQTGSYRWLEGRSPIQIEVATAPTWMIEQMLVEQQPAAAAPIRSLPLFDRWDDLDWARSYLDAIPATEDYDQWLQVGMALHSVSESLLGDWDSWSRGASNYEASACEKKWKSFKPGKGVGIGTLATIAKQYGWKSPKPEPALQSLNGSKPAIATSEPAAKQSVLSPEDLDKAIDGLIRANTPQSQLEAMLPVLAKQTGRTSSDIWRLYRARVDEVEQAGTRQVRSKELSGIMAIARSELNLSEYLDPKLAIPLEQSAKAMGSNSAAVLTTLLPVAATLLRVGTKLELAAATSFYALPILYTGILAESGSAKSPTQKLILNPLLKMQVQANDDYNYQLEGYEAAKKRSPDDVPAKPQPHEYYTIDSTREAIATIQCQQPDRGFLGWFDELSALIGGQNQYRSGKGTDKEAILSGRDGTPIKVNRASGKRLFAPHSAYSITGSTQPDTLKKLIGDFSDPSGQWARFLWATLPVQGSSHPDTLPAHDVSDLLGGLYRQIETQTPTLYRFSPEAKAIYVDWFNRLDARRLNEPQQGLRAVFAKMKGDTGVLALLLHCINAAAQGGQPDPLVSVATITSAIKLSQYYLGQVRLIHAEGDGEGTIEDSCSRIIKISQRKGWVTARDVHQNDRAIRKRLPAESIRSLFRELEAMDMGKTSGSGVHIEFRCHDTNNSPDTVLTVESAMVDFATAGNDLLEDLSTVPTKSWQDGQHPDAERVSVSNKSVNKVSTDRLQSANNLPTKSDPPDPEAAEDCQQKQNVGTLLAESRQPVDKMLALSKNGKNEAGQRFSSFVDKNVGIVDNHSNKNVGSPCNEAGWEAIDR